MSSSTPSPFRNEWWRDIGRRLGTWWVAKMLGTTVGMTAFFVVYFQLLNHPVFPVTVMPLTWIDAWVPFHPETIALYVSLWVYVPLAPSLLVDRRQLLSHAAAWVVLSVLGFLMFLFWPTAVPVRDTDWSTHPALAFLGEVDAAGNACPSLHVAFAVLTAIWLARVLRQVGAARWARVGNGLWCAGIVYSTVATRQHVVLDVVAGALLGALVAWGHGCLTTIARSRLPDS